MVSSLRCGALVLALVAALAAHSQAGGFVCATGKPGELSYADRQRGLELFNIGGRRYSLHEGEMFRFLASDPAPDPWGMKNGVVWNGGISGLDFGFSGHALKGANEDDIVLGGKWGLRRADGTVLIPAEQDDIFPVGDLFCACKGGTVKKTWTELSDEDYEEIHGYYTGLKRNIEITKGACALFGTEGLLVPAAQQTYSLETRHDLPTSCGSYAAGMGIFHSFTARTGLDENVFAYTHESGQAIGTMVIMCLRAPTYSYRNAGVVVSDMNLWVQCTGMKPYTPGDTKGEFMPYVLKSGLNGTLLVYDGTNEGRMGPDMQWLLPLQYRSVVDVGARNGTFLYIVSPVMFVEEEMVGCTPDPYDPDMGQWNVFSSALKRPVLARNYTSVLVAENAIIAMLPRRDGANGPVGLFDLNGRELAPAIFDEVQPLKGGLFALRKGGKWGLTDSKGSKLMLADNSYEAVLQKARSMR
jgi:hypothetical protein